MEQRQKIYEKLADILEELFEIERERITMDANLYEDLDIDSIDAIDLIIELKKWVGKKVDPEEFKKVRTIQDIVMEIERLHSSINS